jgi:arginyl-tRNA synthetase
MEKLIDQISARVSEAFEIAGYDPALGRCAPSNRPDLCQYQCNGAMAGAKIYHTAPFAIAEKVANVLAGEEMFSKAEAVRPGFLNLDISPACLAGVMAELEADPSRCGAQPDSNPQTIIIDYGGPNVAKPLHVGHLRSAIIGESLKRIARFKGHQVIGDIHLGDWGLQIGQIIAALLRNPEFRARLLSRTAELLSGPLSDEALLAEIDRLYEELEPEVARNNALLGFDKEKWIRNVGYLRSRIEDGHWSESCIQQLCHYINVTAEERALYFGD